MTEAAPAKSRFTRRRVIAGGILLVIVLAVFALFGAFERNPKNPVRVQFVRFEGSAEGKATFAVVIVKNVSRRPVRLIGLSIEGEWIPSRWGGWGLDKHLQPASEVTDRVLLHTNGCICRIEAAFFLEPLSVSPTTERMLESVGLTPAKDWTLVRAVCDQEIQCPLVLPDGTIQPARVVPEGTAQ